ncbi:MAG: phosphoribosylanthranilate isomerase [Bacillota bacterium]
MWIKVCGIKTIETAVCCIEAGADAVGFVFAESRRKVSVDQTAEIIRVLPPEVEKVGVFFNNPFSDVLAIDSALGLDLLQFHGEETPQYCNRFTGRALKSFRIAKLADLEDVKKYRGSVKACLLDSFEAGQPGGTGKAWDWAMFSTMVNQELAGFNLIVAGGLTAQNVKVALQHISPYGVDISSGVERAGQKDCDLIREFINTVRRCENEQPARL